MQTRTRNRLNRCMLKTSLLLVFIFFVLHSDSIALAAQPAGDWQRLITLADAILGEQGVFDVQGTESRIDAIVDLHAKYCAVVLGNPPSSQQVYVLKQATRLFLKNAQTRYSGDARSSALNLIKDLVTNRGLFIELL